MPKRWSYTAEVHGVRVRVYERPNGVIYTDVRHEVNGQPVRERRSLGHQDKRRARDYADRLAKRIADYTLAGGVPDVLELGQLANLYGHNHPDLEYSRAMAIRQVLDFMVQLLGDGFPVRDLGASHVREYIRRRKAGTLSRERVNSRGGVKDATILNELRTFNSVLIWATGYRRDGVPLLASNPFKAEAVRNAFPEVKKRARPIASESRYRALLSVADQVEPTGRLRLALMLAWETGRRIGAILQLRASDIALSHRALWRILAETGEDEALADAYDSAIRWRGSADKKGLTFVTPITRTAHDALSDYIEARGLIGEALLFPHDVDPTESWSRSSARYYLGKAEEAADVPHQQRGGFHAFRRAWAMRRKGLPIQDVAAAGGWSDTQTLARIYQRADADGVRAAVELGDGVPQFEPRGDTAES